MEDGGRGAVAGEREREKERGETGSIGRFYPRVIFLNYPAYVLHNACDRLSLLSLLWQHFFYFRS